VGKNCDRDRVDYPNDPQCASYSDDDEEKTVNRMHLSK